jgi:hypothetical protein
LNEKIQREVFQHLKKKKIENCIGVTDSTLKHFIDEYQKNNNIIITTGGGEVTGIVTEVPKRIRNRVMNSI